MLPCKVMSSRGIGISGLAVGLALSLGKPSLAYGQSDDDRAGARAAAAAGIESYNTGHYAEAYDLLTRAETLVHAPTHMLYMARSAAKLGHLVQAREIYIKVCQEQLVSAAPRAFIDAQQAAVQEQRIIEARLAYLTVTVEGANSSEVKVSIDSRLIPSVLIGVPFPVDPGTHNIVAKASSSALTDTVKASLAEGQSERITLTVRANNSAPVPVAVPTPATSSPQAAAQASPAAPSAPAGAVSNHESNTAKTPALAWVSLGVGAVGAGLGTVFLIQHSSKKSDANSAFNACNANGCTPTEHDNVLSLDKSAATAGTLALVSYGVGAAAITTGLYLVFSSSSKADAPKESARFVPSVGPRFVGATLNF